MRFKTTFSEQWDTNPYTGSAWTWEEIDALEIGVALRSDGFNWANCTQTYAEVDYSSEVSGSGLTDAEDITITTTAGTVNQPPVLNPIGNKAVNVDEQLQFTISATDPEGDSLSYSASNLPQGASFNPTTRTFSWTPDTAGAYPNIHFEVSDGKLADAEDITITITAGTANQPPVANAGPDQTVNEDEIVEFDGSGSYDSSGTIVAYQWDFGDGSPTKTGQTVSHVYSAPGIYTTTLTVTDEDNNMDMDIAQITINPVAPTTTEEFSFSGSISKKEEQRHIITISSPGAISMSVKLTPARMADMVLRIYNPSGLLVQSVDQSSWSSEETVIQSLEAGDWQVAAYVKWVSSQAPYTLEGVIIY